MIGRNVGHYRVTRQIGRGGMGQVFEAVHDEIERRAAIKLLLPQFTNDADAAARFLHELRGPNLRRDSGCAGVGGTAAEYALPAAESAGENSRQTVLKSVAAVAVHGKDCSGVGTHDRDTFVPR